MVYIKAMQENAENDAARRDQIERGLLQINVTSDVDSYPVSDAVISVSYTGEIGRASCRERVFITV